MRRTNTTCRFFDSILSDYRIYEGTERVYLATGGNVVVDSLFNVGQQDSIVKLLQKDPFDREGLLVNRDTTLMRQLSKWGGGYDRWTISLIKRPLKYETKGDKKTCACLYMCIILRLCRLVSTKFYIIFVRRQNRCTPAANTMLE